MSAPRRIRRRWRIALAIAVLAIAWVLLAHPLAGADDALSNVAPASQLPGGSLANAYPLGNYQLDHYFDAVSAGVLSGVDASGVAPTISWFLAQTIWMLTAFLANAVITLFTFAFSLDLVNGSGSSGGVLGPIAVAIRSIYQNTFGEPWLVVAILLTGVWAMWNALVRRRYTETAGALGLSLAFVVIALAFVTRPEIVGQASRWTNRVSGAFLALSTHGSLGNQDQAKQADADQLFDVLVYEPWVVLDFGGLEHCVAGSGSQQRSVPVQPLSHDPSRGTTLADQLATGTEVQADGKVCVSNRNKYAPHFLQFAPDSSERGAEHDALANGDAGKLPDADPAKADGSYHLGAIDKPAAEAMGKSGQYQRLLLAIVIFLGELGAFLLLGALAVAVILAQLLLLVLLAFAPVALVLGVFPGHGHAFFLGWLSRLGSYLVRKAIYSLLLAVLLAVASALADATSSLGWLMAFALQAVFYWTVLLNRRHLVGRFTRTPGTDTDKGGKLAAITFAAARLATRQTSPPPPPPPPSGRERRADHAPPSPPDTNDRDGSGPAPTPRDDGPAGPDDSSPGSGPAGPPDPGPPRPPGDAATPLEPPAPSHVTAHRPTVRPQARSRTRRSPGHEAQPPSPRPRERSADERPGRDRSGTDAAPVSPPLARPGASVRASDRHAERIAQPPTVAAPVPPVSSERGEDSPAAGRPQLRRESPLERSLGDDARRLRRRAETPAPAARQEHRPAADPRDLGGDSRRSDRR